MTTARRLALTLGSSGVILALNVIGGVLSARTLGVSGRGLLAAITLWPVTIAYLGDLGVPLALTYFAAAETDLRPALLSTALVIGLVQVVVLALAGVVIVAFALGPRYGASSAILAAIFMVAWIPVNLLGRYPNAINQGAQRFRSYNLVRLTVAVVYVAGSATCFLLQLRSVPWFLAATWAASGTAAILALAGLHERVTLRGYQAALVRRILGYGLRAHIGNVAPIDVFQLDLLAVVVLIGAQASGLYSVASSAAGVLQTAAVAFGVVAMPALAASAAGDRGRLAGLFMKTALVLIGVTGVVLFALIGYLLPLVYGRPFQGAVPLAQTLIVAAFLGSMRVLLGGCMRGMGRPLAATVSEVSGLVAGIIALAVLVPARGALGAAEAMIIAYACSLAITTTLAVRAGLPLRRLVWVSSDEVEAGRRLLVGLRGARVA